MNYENKNLSKGNSTSSMKNKEKHGLERKNSLGKYGTSSGVTTIGRKGSAGVKLKTESNKIITGIDNALTSKKIMNDSKRNVIKEENSDSIVKAKLAITKDKDMPQVDKLALETVIMEEELRRLRSNIQRDRENRQNIPKEGGIWKSSKKIMEQLGETNTKVRPMSSGSSRKNTNIKEYEEMLTPKARVLPITEPFDLYSGEIVRAKDSTEGKPVFKPTFKSNAIVSSPPQFTVVPIAGTQYDEILPVVHNVNQNAESSTTEYDEEEPQILYIRQHGTEERVIDNNKSPTVEGGALLGGDYDEDLQRKLFQEALMKWRGNNQETDNHKIEQKDQSVGGNNSIGETKKVNLSLDPTFVNNLCDSVKYTYFDLRFSTK
ncbi:hypothetical protein ABK040_005888 [Willaertia magna]